MSIPAQAIDVVIATRNRPRDLSRMLTSLTTQRFMHFRVFVLDQSDDVAANAAIIGELDDSRFCHVPTESRGKSRALNEAIVQHSTTSVVAFSDDDCEVDADWLATVVASVQRHPNAGIIFGQLHAVSHNASEFFVPAIEFTSPRTIDRPFWRSHGLIGMGANMIVRRSVFERIGLFDEDLGPGGILYTGEETEFMYRALRAGVCVVQDPSLHVSHWGLRPWAGGSAARVLAEGYFATLAGHGKHVRQGDWRAVTITLHETLWSTWMIVTAILRMKRPFHIRRFAELPKGFWAGLSRGPAWPGFVQPPTPSCKILH